MNAYKNTGVSLLWLAGALIPAKYQGQFQVAKIDVQEEGFMFGNELLRGAHIALSALMTRDYAITKFSRRHKRALQDVEASLYADEVIHCPKLY